MSSKFLSRLAAAAIAVVILNGIVATFAVALWTFDGPILSLDVFQPLTIGGVIIGVLLSLIIEDAKSTSSNTPIVLKPEEADVHLPVLTREEMLEVMAIAFETFSKMNVRSGEDLK